jgi:CBS domain-containing protein
MHARDIMTSPVVTALPDSPVLEIVQLMLDKHISALPIVAPDGTLVGLVSEGDLIRRSELSARDYSSWWLSAIGGKIVLAEEFVKSHGMRAADVMTRDVVTVCDDTPVGKIAEILEKNKIKRVPVMADGKIVGIVSRANLLQALAANHEMLQKTPSVDDRALRERVVGVLEGEEWSDLPHLNVVVQDGVVHFWGRVHCEQVRQALKVAAEGVAGVKGIVDHTHKTMSII